ncbi:MAG: NADP-dependent oxidoreductase [Bacteroidota bacterium]|nr:NADP-dependent oxidoreductase [Bacteroidota bacterium]
MKAIRIHEFGGPEVLKYEDAQQPIPAADEVLIKIHASGVNPIDFKIREGHAKGIFTINFPLILGWDVSGEIEEVGSEILSFRIGDEVYSRPDPTRDGTYAEYVTVKADQVNQKPKSIDHYKAAAVPLAGLTAWQGLFTHGYLKAGQKVLIHAASGGVGTYAVQFARWKGAYVIGTTSEENIDFLYDLGADEVIDYKNEKFEDDIKDVDLVFDLIGGDTQKRSLQVLKNGGRLITTVKPENLENAKSKSIHLEGFMAQSLPGDLQQIADLIDSGKVKPVIARIMPLRDAAEAQTLSEEGHVRGKIVLKVI